MPVLVIATTKTVQSYEMIALFYMHSPIELALYSVLSLLSERAPESEMPRRLWRVTEA